MLASLCRGFGTIHLLPLDPGIEQLHHKSVFFLGASHILVQNAQEEQELHMIGLGCEDRNDREGRRLGFVSFIDLAILNEVFIALDYILTPIMKKWVELFI